jgi:hypothetical protein
VASAPSYTSLARDGVENRRQRDAERLPTSEVVRTLAGAIAELTGILEAGHLEPNSGMAAFSRIRLG